jgi:serine/threonine-protein kinase
MVVGGCGFFEGDQTAPLATHAVVGPRIVVIPFENAGPAADAFFAAGLTDEIAVRLAAVSGLAVISDSSATAGQTENASLRRIGSELGAEYVLSGTVHWDRKAERLQTEPRLVRVVDAAEIWSSAFDRAFSDVFTVQSDIVMSVVETLGVAVMPNERYLLELRPTDNLAAYEAYLRSLPYRWSFELAELELAEGHLQHAIELDPGFAHAHVALSENHSLMFHFRYDRSPQRLANANARASRALEIEPGLPEGHRALGYYYYWGQQNFEQALAEFSLAAAGRPNDPLIVSSIGIVLRRQGRWDEAMDAFQRAIQLDPKNDLNLIDLASTCGRMRRYQEAVEHCQRAIDLAPEAIFPYVFMARMLRARDGSVDRAHAILEAMPDKDPAQQGFYWFEQSLFERDFATAIERLASTGQTITDPINEEVFPRGLAECQARVLGGASAESVSACASARSRLERDVELSPVDPAIHSALGWTYALSGHSELAIASGERAVELLPVSADAMAGHSHLVRLAKIYAWAGEPFQAVRTIEKALAMPGWLSVSTLRIDPDWDPIRNDPRFQELLRIHSEPES